MYVFYVANGPREVTEIKTLRPRGERWHRERFSPSLAEAAHAFLILFDPRLNLLTAEFARRRQFSCLRAQTLGNSFRRSRTPVAA